MVVMYLILANVLLRYFNRRCCVSCVDNLSKGSGYKQHRDNLRKHATGCSVCHHTFYPGYSVVTWEKCNE